MYLFRENLDVSEFSEILLKLTISPKGPVMNAELEKFDLISIICLNLFNEICSQKYLRILNI